MNSPAETRSASRIAFSTLLRLGGSALILILLFHFLPLAQVRATLARLPLDVLLLVLAGYLATHGLGICKWRLMVNLAGAGLDYAQAARCYFLGLFGSLFLPSLIGGDLLRAGLALRLGRSKAGVLLGSLLDRLLDLAALTVLTAAGALLVPGTLRPESRRVFGGLAAAAVLAAAAFAGILALLPARRFSYRVRRRLVRLRQAGRSMSRRPQYVLVALSLAMLAQVCFILLTMRLATACGLELRLRVWLFAWPLAKLSAALPVTQGGIGVREAALVALLAPFGAPAVLTVAVGLAWEAVIIGGALMSGLASLLLGAFSASAESRVGSVNR